MTMTMPFLRTSTCSSNKLLATVWLALALGALLAVTGSSTPTIDGDHGGVTPFLLDASHNNGGISLSSLASVTALWLDPAATTDSDNEYDEFAEYDEDDDNIENWDPNPDHHRDITANNNKNNNNNQNKRTFLRGLQSTTTTSTSTSVNIFQKLGESLGMTIVGAILICCIPFLIYKNEGRHVQQLAKIDYFKNHATLVDCNAPGEATMGQLVHFVGNVTVGDAFLDFDAEDSKLNLLEPIPKAILLKRTCYIYQKFETASQSTQKNRVGGGETRTTNYTLREDWTPLGPQQPTLPHFPDQTNSRGIWDELVNAAGTSSSGSGSGYQAPATPALPPELLEKLGIVDTSKPPHEVTVSLAARVGAFGLTKNVIMEHPQVFSDNLQPVPSSSLPGGVPGCTGLTRGSDNVLRTFPEGAQPHNGDCKVVYEYAPDGFDCSFIVQQTSKPSVGGDEDAKFGVDKAHVVDNKCFGVCKNDLGEVWMVRKGRLDLNEMIVAAKDEEKKILYLIRVVSCVLLLAGWIMLFAPFTTALEVLPLLSGLGFFAVVLTGAIVSVTCCATITILAYIQHRPLLAILLLAVAGGIWGIVAWRLDIAADTGG